MASEQTIWRDRFGDRITHGAEAVLGPPCPATFQLALVKVVGFGRKNVKVEVEGNGPVLSVRPEALMQDRDKYNQAVTGIIDQVLNPDAKVIRLHGDRGGKTLEKFAGRLQQYFDEQGPEIEAWRSAVPGERPYPDPDNPAFGYLISRAAEILDEDGSQAALIWLGAHAWFEGGLAEMTATRRTDPN